MNHFSHGRFRFEPVRCVGQCSMVRWLLYTYRPHSTFIITICLLLRVCLFIFILSLSFLGDAFHHLSSFGPSPIVPVNFVIDGSVFPCVLSFATNAITARKIDNPQSVRAGVRWVGIWRERMGQIYVRIHSGIGVFSLSRMQKSFFFSFGIARSATWNFIFDFAWASVQRIENFHKYRCDELMVLLRSSASTRNNGKTTKWSKTFFFSQGPNVHYQENSNKNAPNTQNSHLVFRKRCFFQISHFLISVDF